MKKITIILAVASLFLLSACTLFSKDGANETLAGILSAQAYGDDFYGSHLLTSEDGKNVAINSTVLNLSSSEYLGNKVEVQAVYDEKNDVYNVQGISVVEILNGFKGEPELVDYMSTSLGIKLKYYNSYQLVESIDSVKFTAPAAEVSIDAPVVLDTPPMRINRSNNPDNKTLSDFVAAGTRATVTDSIIGTDQLQAKTYKDAGLVYYVFERAPYFYTVSFPESDTKFVEMLNSLQFVPITTEVASGGEVVPTSPAVTTPESAPTLEAKTYDFVNFADFQSSAYAYKAKYPKTWYYDGTVRDTGILSQYRFSDKPIEDGITTFGSLKLLSDKTLPAGTKMKFPNGDGVKVESGDQVQFYVQLEDRVYLVEGSKEKADSLEAIAASIQKAE